MIVKFLVIFSGVKIFGVKEKGGETQGEAMRFWRDYNFDNFGGEVEYGPLAPYVPSDPERTINLSCEYLLFQLQNIS